MWKTILLSLIKSLGLAALETGSAVVKEKLTPKDGTGKNSKTPT